MPSHFLPTGSFIPDKPVNLPVKRSCDLYFVFLGEIILSRSKKLSKDVNRELLEPISKWIDDPNWMKRYRKYEDHVPKWGRYKKHQRQRNRRFGILWKEQLRKYRQEIRQVRLTRSAISSLNGRGPPTRHIHFETDQNIMSSIVTPFSPPEQRRSETIQQFQRSRKASFSDLLPWRLLLSSELTTVKSFSDLKVYGHDKQDKAAKLIHLLHMETEGKVRTIQEKPFGEIRIEPMDIVPKHNIMVKDRHSCEYLFEWHSLSNNQKDKIIADIKANQIVCKAV